MNKGKLIVVEGPDGVGKSTITRQLIQEFELCSESAICMAFPGREEGTLGRMVYRFHHEPEVFDVASCSELSRQLLHIAAHIDLIEKRIVPVLNSGTHVVLDRFWWSTLVYGIVNGANESTLRCMLEVEHSVWNGVVPHLAVLLTRSQPFVPRPEVLKWKELSSEYLRVANSEMNNYPILILNLDHCSDRLYSTIFAKIRGSS